VLDGEQSQQEQIDDNRFAYWHERSAIERLGHRYAGHKTDGVEEAAKKTR
jgi:hypothetical protein